MDTMNITDESFIQNESEQVHNAKSMHSWELPEFDESIRNTIKFYIRKARSKFHLSEKELPMPLLSYDLKGSFLGTMELVSSERGLILEKPRYTLYLNLVYMKLDMHQVLNETIPHEIGHYVTWILYPYPGIRAHGKEWHSVCEGLGHCASRTARAPKYRKAALWAKEIVLKEIDELNVEDF